MRNFNVVVKEGNEMMMLMKTKAGYFLAIIHRIAADDYVFCTWYDVTDGTWGQGHYCGTYADAYRTFVEYVG